MASPELTTSSLLAALCSQLTQSLNQSSRNRWDVTLSPAAPVGNPVAATSTIFRLTFSGSLHGESFLAINLADIPQLDLDAPSVSTDAEEASTDPEDKAPGDEALASMLAACVASLQTGLSSTNPVDITCVRVDAIDAGDGTAIHELQLASEDGTKSFRATMILGQALVASLQPPLEETITADLTDDASNLDLVLDVELNVTLRFGQRQLPLREVLELKSGAVVELDRQVDEPVELVLDGKVIALGEAVIIDGNYGMRITQVVQPILVS